jgi:hypothetical protein
MAYSKRLIYEPLRSLDTSTLSGSYLPIGTPLAYPASIVKMVNTSNILLLISVDGINDHDVVPANSFWLYDETANTPTHGADAVFIPQGTQFLVNGSSGTGVVYLVVQYIYQV